VTDADPRSDDTEGLEPPSAIFSWIRRSGKRIAVTIVGLLVLDRAKQQAKKTLETATGSPLLIALSVTLTLAAIAGVLLWFFALR
jgi:hypothetical protein